MVTEEPSVIAAASYASKLINLAGGTTTIQEKREMIGEISIVKSPLTLERVKAKLNEQKESLFTMLITRTLPSSNAVVVYEIFG